jgi:hypothetical protein
MSPASCLRRTCLAVSILVLAASAQAQAVYTWKDAKGVTHYSDSPPPKSAGEPQVKTVNASAPATPTANAPAAQAAPAPGTTTAATAAVAKAASDAAAANARCSQARANLTALQGTAPVGPDADGDGKPDSTLGDDDRAKQIAAMRATIQRDCSGG